jgi:hypothetical protein
VPRVFGVVGNQRLTLEAPVQADLAAQVIDMFFQDCLYLAFFVEVRRETC